MVPLSRANTYVEWYRYLELWNGTAREASWRRAFDPCAPLLFILYHYFEQNLHFGLVPEPPWDLSAQVLPGCRVRHP